MDRHVGLLSDFPEIQALGQDPIQELCDEWVRTPAARECGVQKVLIGDAGHGLDMLDLQIRIDITPEPGFHDPKEIEIPFPVDNLRSFLIERVIPTGQQDELKRRVAAKRRNAPYVYRRYKTAKPQRLYMRCKSCHHIMETQYSLLPQQKMGGTFDPFTCPDCGVEQPLAAEDFGFLEDIKGRS